MLPRIYSDFNNKDELNRVRLDVARSEADLERAARNVAVGAHVILYMDDEYEVEAVLEFDASVNLWLATPIYSTIVYYDEEDHARSERSRIDARTCARLN